MSTVFAASTMSVPAGTVIFLPSIVRLTSGICGDLANVALVPEGVVLVLLAEVAQGGVDHPPTRVAEAAQAAAVLQPIGDPLQGVEVELRPLVGKDALVGSHSPVLADAARRA